MSEDTDEDDGAGDEDEMKSVHWFSKFIKYIYYINQFLIIKANKYLGKHLHCARTTWLVVNQQDIHDLSSINVVLYWPVPWYFSSDMYLIHVAFGKTN